MFPPPTPTAGPTFPIAVDHHIVSGLVLVAGVAFTLAFLMLLTLVVLATVRLR
jgi:hypothetical protein